MKSNFKKFLVRRGLFDLKVFVNYTTGIIKTVCEGIEGKATYNPEDESNDLPFKAGFGINLSIRRCVQNLISKNVIEMFFREANYVASTLHKYIADGTPEGAKRYMYTKIKERAEKVLSAMEK